MKKLSYSDLTPELLKELMTLSTEAEIVDACAAKDYEISAENAGKLLEQLRKAAELSKEHLEVVPGGKDGYSGTKAKKLLSSIIKGIDFCPEYVYNCMGIDNCGLYCPYDS